MRSVAERVVACTVSLALCAVGIPVSTRADTVPVPTEILVKTGADIFRIDMGNVLFAWEGILKSKSGSASIALLKAIWPENTAPEPPGSSFAFDGTPGPADVTMLGRTLDEASQNSDRPLSEVIEWREIVRVTAAASGDCLTVEFKTGRDVQSIALPWSLLGLTDPNPSASLQDVIVTVNGMVATVPLSTLNTVVQAIMESGAVPSHIEGAESVEGLLQYFHDHVKFVGNYAGFSAIMTTLLQRLGQPRPNGCWWVCGGCALALAGYGLSIASIILSCGSLSPACILAILGHEIAAASVVMACADCGRCLGGDFVQRENVVTRPTLPVKIQP